MAAPFFYQIAASIDIQLRCHTVVAPCEPVLINQMRTTRGTFGLRPRLPTARSDTRPTRSCVSTTRQNHSTEWAAPSTRWLRGRTTAAQVGQEWMAGVEVLVYRGDGKGFVFLAVDTGLPIWTPPPAASGQSALWKYKSIYLQADPRVGQWSDAISIPVAG